MLQVAKDSQDVSVEVYGVNELTGLAETGLSFFGCHCPLRPQPSGGCCGFSGFAGGCGCDAQ